MTTQAGKRAPAPAAGRGRFKGAAFIEFLRWYGRTHGEHRLVEAGKSLAPELRAGLVLDRQSLGVLTGSWYHAETVHALLDALIGGLDEASRRRLAATASSAIMDATLRGIYRGLFRVIATPERYAKHVHRLWSVYYDTGTVQIVMTASNRAVSTIRDWPSHHPFICDLNRGAAEAIYRAMGCKGAEAVRTSCVDGGSPECRFVITWP